MKGDIRMKIAVSVNGDNQISTHFGKSKEVNIYQVEGSNVEFMETRAVPDGLQSHNFKFITDCDIVISGSIGASMQEQLKQGGIVPIVVEETDPIVGIESLFVDDGK